MDNKKSVIRSTVIWLGLPILIFLAVLFVSRQAKPENYSYSQIIQYFIPGTKEMDNLESFSFNLGTGELSMKLRSKTEIKLGDKTNEVEKINYKVPNVSVFINDIDGALVEYNRDHADKPISYNYIQPANYSWLSSLLPTIILIVCMGFIWYFMMKRMGAMNGTDKQFGFGKAKIKQIGDEKRKTTFDDVAGADEEKEELREIVEFLKNPKKYNELGARIPSGVLLVGPPGTGKTLLARAVAGEAGVPFFSISGSDFVEMFVGVGASRVRDLFEQAKKNHPCIIFIDEIDAVGRHRGAGLGGGHDEREQTLNQLLVEMDGFGANEGVIIMAATNRPDILDPALTRPGRFDRQVTVGYPDVKGREAILKVHSKGKPLAPDVNLETVAKTTAGFTGADLENLLNEAALLSARKDKKAVTMTEIEEAVIKVIVGTEKKSHVMNEKEKKLTAYHEAGHAIVTHYCETQDPVHQISIIPTGMAGGYTMHLPQEDRSYRTRNEMKDSIAVLLGGRVAEALILSDISTGASNDIERATQTARSMVTKYGMSEKIGPILLGSEQNEVFLAMDMGHVRDYSEVLAAEVDKEIKALITWAYDKAETILNEHMPQLHAVAKHLYEHEKIDGSDFEKLIDKATNGFADTQGI